MKYINSYIRVLFASLDGIIIIRDNVTVYTLYAPLWLTCQKIIEPKYFSTLKFTVIWNVDPCSSVERHLNFGGTCCLSSVKFRPKDHPFGITIFRRDTVFLWRLPPSESTSSRLSEFPVRLSPFQSKSIEITRLYTRVFLPTYKPVTRDQQTTPNCVTAVICSFACSATRNLTFGSQKIIRAWTNLFSVWSNNYGIECSKIETSF